jgi:hypothetical protein
MKDKLLVVKNYIKVNILPILFVILLLLGQNAYLSNKNEKLLTITAKFGHFVGCLQATQGFVPVCVAFNKAIDVKLMIEMIKKDQNLQKELEKSEPTKTVETIKRRL